ncbi:MAG: septal ring lytic transglycosylase RlpA family protein [Nitrospirota bacterium]
MKHSLQGMAFLCCLFLTVSCSSKKSPVPYSPDSTPRHKASQKPYTVFGQRYEPLATHEQFMQSGIASWYGRDFHGKKTSNGERYDMYGMTAAHKTLPLGVHVKVYHVQNGREVTVRVNDRGPFVKGRIIDLSYAAAKKLGVDVTGTAFVRIEALGYKDDSGEGRTLAYREPASYITGTYTIQVGSFKQTVNAERLSGEMKRLYGFSDVRATTVNGDMFYRVYAGKYTSLTDAEVAEKKFVQSGYPGSFVVSLD